LAALLLLTAALLLASTTLSALLLASATLTALLLTSATLAALLLLTATLLLASATLTALLLTSATLAALLLASATLTTLLLASTTLTTLLAAALTALLTLLLLPALASASASASALLGKDHCVAEALRAGRRREGMNGTNRCPDQEQVLRSHGYLAVWIKDVPRRLPAASARYQGACEREMTFIFSDATARRYAKGREQPGLSKA
jgi:hypothetical protein